MEKLKISASLDRHINIVLILPLVIIIGIMIVYPLFYSVQLGFTNRSLMRPTTRFVLFRNYIEILLDGRFWAAFLRSGIWTAGCIFPQLIWGLVMALLLNQDIRGKKIFQVLLILPWTLPGVAFVQMWKWILDPMGGIGNYFLFVLGIIPSYMSWFGQANTAMASAIWTYVWFGFPYMMISILAGLKAIPSSHYDVAKIEGASAFQTFRYVTFPYIRGIITVLLILRTIWVFNNFEIIFLATGGGPGDKTCTLPILTYTTGWQRFLLGKAASITGLMFIFLLLTTVLYLKSLKYVEK